MEGRHSTTNNRALDKAPQQENQNDEKDQPDSTGRGIAPVPAMRPDGRHTEKRRNQDYDQYNPEHGSSSFCFVRECNYAITLKACLTRRRKRYANIQTAVVITSK
jgi:hypothetical protein